MLYLTVKWLHILSSTILFGAGVGSAFHVFRAHRTGELHAIRHATRTVVTADWLFTTPSIIVQFFSGLALMHLAGWSFSDAWLAAAITLFLFAGGCWLPVVWLQIRMRDMAEWACATGEDLPPLYHTYERWWVILGCLAFPAVIVIFYLMVAKPG